MLMFGKENEKLIAAAEKKVLGQFEAISKTAYNNQLKVLEAFKHAKISARHFAGTSGYGYDDLGRDALNEVYAEVFNADSAIVSPLIVSGTHALTLMLFGLLRPGDTAVSVTGMPYDTLTELIKGENVGSLKDFGIRFDSIDLLPNGNFDYSRIQNYFFANSPKLVFIQRSRGYNWRDSLSYERLAEIISYVKGIDKKIIVAVDNCYGEFVEETEPTALGADIIVGSLIKNAGGGFAPTGGYIAGKSKLVELVSYRLTSPSIGCEVGSYAAGYTAFFQGLFMAPTVVAAALKGSILMGQVFSDLGFETLPKVGEHSHDIIRSIKFSDEEQLISFCRSIQAASPVDSFLELEPWDMPGYQHQVIMAAGNFTQGSSIELSADSPIKSPYVAYLQGGLTYEHVKIATQYAVESLIYSDNYAAKENGRAQDTIPVATLIEKLETGMEEMSEKEYDKYLRILYRMCVRARYNCDVDKAESMYLNLRMEGNSICDAVKKLLFLY